MSTAHEPNRHGFAGAATAPQVADADRDRQSARDVAEGAAVPGADLPESLGAGLAEATGQDDDAEAGGPRSAGP
ncbi:MAG TPA: hypothetical protein VNV66_13475 [Pilimelia sp.]|nr:hypothetical protein [Pilimelia sp.]